MPKNLPTLIPFYWSAFQNDQPELIELLETMNLYLIPDCFFLKYAMNTNNPPWDSHYKWVHGLISYHNSNQWCSHTSMSFGYVQTYTSQNSKLARINFDDHTREVVNHPYRKVLPCACSLFPSYSFHLGFGWSQPMWQDLKTLRISRAKARSHTLE
jgi:hypothetical protein